MFETVGNRRIAAAVAVLVLLLFLASDAGSMLSRVVEALRSLTFAPWARRLIVRLLVIVPFSVIAVSRSPEHTICVDIVVGAAWVVVAAGGFFACVFGVIADASPDTASVPLSLFLDTVVFAALVVGCTTLAVVKTAKWYNTPAPVDAEPKEVGS